MVEKAGPAFSSVRGSPQARALRLFARRLRASHPNLPLFGTILRRLVAVHFALRRRLLGGYKKSARESTESEARCLTLLEAVGSPLTPSELEWSAVDGRAEIQSRQSPNIKNRSGGHSSVF